MNKYPMIRVSIITVVLLVLGSFPSTTGFYVRDQQPLPKHIITVGDEPGDGNYTSIKEALNHSSPGDIIEVYSGTYKEHGISITVEGISLIGLPYDPDDANQTGKPFINGQGLYSVFIVDVSNVTISGFHIINNGGAGDWEIICIIPGANNCTISNNTLSASSNSIIECESNYNRITNNSIKWAGSNNGICFDYPAQHNIASGNVIDKCPIGISLYSDKYGTVVGNRISNCSQVAVSVGGWYDVIRYNSIVNNYLGLYIDQCTWNQIKENNFINNTHQASFGEAFGAWTNRWSHNYWGRPRLLPYPIQGINLIIFPWVQFDWRPALKPYNISTMNEAGGLP